MAVTNYSRISAYIAEDDKKTIERWCAREERPIGWFVTKGIRLFMKANNLISDGEEHARANKKKTGTATEKPDGRGSQHTWRREKNQTKDQGKNPWG